MTVFKVVRRYRGKLYSAIMRKCDSKRGLKYMKYGMFWTRQPKGHHPLLAFADRELAEQFFIWNTMDGWGQFFELWKADVKIADYAHVNEIGRNGDWPAGTIHCSAIKLTKKIKERPHE